jgi:hypothetical protein
VAEVRVTVGVDLERKASEYGARDVEQLRHDLQADVEQALRRKGRLTADGVRLELVITDAMPNRPTYEQSARRPDLSLRSIGLGGATIEGRETGPDGQTRSLRFRWYEDDLRNETGAATWSDAEQAFDLFARKYADGDL